MAHRHQKPPTAEEVIAAIKDSAGIKTTIGNRLGVHRNTVDRYLTNYPTAMQAYKNEVESVGDFVEAVILEAIKAKDIETSKWYAKNKLKDRGYTERIEFREIKEMSDAELVAFIAERAGGTSSSRDVGGTAASDLNSPTIH